MKVFLETSVYGNGYTVKAYDAASRRQLDDEALQGHEKTLYMRSNARLLLANVEGRRFGFARGVETGELDDNKRPRHINLALEGEAGEIDPVFCQAAEDYPTFAGLVRAMTRWEGADFSIDWAAFDALLAEAGEASVAVDTKKPVAMVEPYPSVEYFLKNSGMDWQRSDIARLLEAKNPGARKQDMNVFFYCPSPSIGWTIKQVDEATGEVKREGRDARARLSRESLAILDNYGGCSMALFRSGVRQCFLVKEVKADSANQYGQNKTVTLVVESAVNPRAVRQLAMTALLDYPAFKERLLDCVKISASTVGFTVNGEKLAELLEPLKARVRPDDGDGRLAEWDALSGAPLPSQPFTFLVLETSLDYFRNSTGLDIGSEQVFRVYDEEAVSRACPPMRLIPDAQTAQPPEPAGQPEPRVPEISEPKTQEPEARGSEVPKPEKAETCGPGKPEARKPGESVREESYRVPASPVRVAGEVEKIDLLDYKWFKMMLCGLVALVLVIGGVLIFRRHGGDQAVPAGAPAAIEESVPEEEATGEDTPEEAATEAADEA